MATIDIDALRVYMEDYFGTAMMSGFPVALLDLADLDSLDGWELCELAEGQGIDLRKFQVDE